MNKTTLLMTSAALALSASMTVAQNRVAPKPLKSQLEARGYVEPGFTPSLPMMRQPQAQNRVAHVPARTQGAASTFYGYVSYSDIYQSGYMYEMTHQGIMTQVAPIAYEPTAGGVLRDGIYHSIYVDSSNATWGYYTFLNIAYDTQDWSIVKNQALYDGGYGFYCFALTEIPGSDLALGCFMSKMGDEYQICTFDFETGVKTFLKGGTTGVIAMSTYNGSIYGLGTDENFYSIDPTTGEMTQIGAVGVSYVYNGTFYPQSFAIDQRSGVGYWPAMPNYYDDAALYSIDLTTGAATRLETDFPYTQVLGMVPMPAEAEDNAPAAVSNLNADFVDAELTGRITFVAPLSIYAGNEALSGELSYQVLDDNVTLAEGNVTPGAEVSLTITVAEGMHTFAVVTVNAAGTSPKAKLSKYIGNDEPCAPTDVVLTATEDGDITLSWSASTSGVHQGYVSQVTYNVFRVIDEEIELVAEQQTATSFNEQLTLGKMAKYSYLVEAVSAGKVSAKASSEAVSLGYFDSYFHTNFEDANDLNLFTIIDADGDGSSWKRDMYWPSAVLYSSNIPADDWLITPGIQVTGGHTYKLTYIAYSGYDRMPEKLTVTMGMGNTIEEQTQVLKPEHELGGNAYPAELEFVAPETGKIFIGFRCTSGAFNYGLFIEQITIEAGPDHRSPDAVQNLVITADSDCKLQATFSFDAPSLTRGGEPLTELTKIEVFNELGLCGTITAEPGAHIEQMIETQLARNNTFTLIPYNSFGAGTATTMTTYIGPDVPVAPAYCNAEVFDDRIVLTWPRVSEVGANGGKVNPDEVKYVVFYSGAVSADEIDQVTDTTYTYMVDTKNCDPELMQFAIWNENISGYSKLTYCKPVIVGRIAQLPLVESFPANASDNKWWFSNKGLVNNWKFSSGNEYVGYDSSNGDNGFAKWTCLLSNDTDEPWGAINTFRYTMRGMMFPKVGYHCKATDPSMKLYVEAITPGGEIVSIDMVDFAEKPINEWIYSGVEIPYQLGLEDWVIFRFRASGTVDYSVMKLDEVEFSSNVEIPSNIEIIDAEGASDAFYTIDGIRVNKMRQGFYIRNGKKILTCY